jgi:hypothetical protein
MPSHPIAVRATLPPAVKELIAAALVVMSGTASGIEVLRGARIARYVGASGARYAPLGEIGPRPSCPAALAGGDQDSSRLGAA